MQTTVVRIANKLQISHTLVNSNGPVAGRELAQKTGADHVLLLRLLRYLIAIHAIGQAGVDLYTANNVTRNLIVPQLEAGVNHTYDVVGSATMALPSFLAKNNYQNPTDPKNCAFQEAFHTQDSIFEWFSKHPEPLNNFNLWMTGQRDGRVGWLDFFPFEERITRDFQRGDGAVMLVDVGGALGHEVLAIKKKYPSLPGRFVLQDLPATIEQALPVPGMEAVVHDFFTEQPIKGQYLNAKSSDSSAKMPHRCTRLLPPQRPSRLARRQVQAHPLQPRVSNDSPLFQDTAQRARHPRHRMRHRRSPSGHYHDGLRGSGRALGEAVAGPAGFGGAEDREDLDGRTGGGKYHRVGIEMSCRQHRTGVGGERQVYHSCVVSSVAHATATATLALIVGIILRCCYGKFTVPLTKS